MTLEELYNKVMSDRDMMAEFVKASSTDTLSEFAESQGCKATNVEIRKYFMGKCGDTVPENSEGEIADDELENVSGGSIMFFKWVSSLFTTLFGGGEASEFVKPTLGSHRSSSVVTTAPTPCPAPSNTLMIGGAPAASNAVLKKSGMGSNSDITVRLC